MLELSGMTHFRYKLVICRSHIGAILEVSSKTSREDTIDGARRDT